MNEVCTEGRTKDWREICEAAANEPDPIRLMELIVELNRALDEHDKKRHEMAVESLRGENCRARSSHLSPKFDCVGPA